MFGEISRTTIVCGNHDDFPGYVAFYDDTPDGWDNSPVFGQAVTPGLAIKNLVAGNVCTVEGESSAFSFFTRVDGRERKGY